MWVRTIHESALYTAKYGIFGSFLYPVPPLYDEKLKVLFIIPLSEEGENMSDISCEYETKDLNGKSSCCPRSV